MTQLHEPTRRISCAPSFLAPQQCSCALWRIVSRPRIRHISSNDTAWKRLRVDRTSKQRWTCTSMIGLGWLALLATQTQCCTLPQHHSRRRRAVTERQRMLGKHPFLPHPRAIRCEKFTLIRKKEKLKRRRRVSNEKLHRRIFNTQQKTFTEFDHERNWDCTEIPLFKSFKRL